MLLWSCCALACKRPTAQMRACATIDDPAQQADCQFEVALSHIHDPDTLHRDLHAISDAPTHDLLLLRLIVAAPEHATDLCQSVRTPEARGKCAHLADRPHLADPGPP